MTDKKTFYSLRRFLDEASDEEIQRYYLEGAEQMTEMMKEFKRNMSIKFQWPTGDERLKENLRLATERLEQVEQWRRETGKSLEEIENMNFLEVYQLVEDWKKSGSETLSMGLELLESIAPKKYIIPNNKLINKLTDGAIHYDNPTDLIVNRGKEVITKVILNYDDENIQVYDKDKKFTSYDRSVHNAVCSIFEAGNSNFTPDQVYRCMNGLSDSQYVSPQAVGAITKSLDKSRKIYAKVDYSAEAKAYKKDIENCIIEDHILSAKKVTLVAGGHEVTGYKLNSKPLLYEYAQVTGQVLTVPIQLLNTKDVIRTTPDVMAIRELLIRRIEVMKNNGKQGNKITFEKVYAEIGQTEPTKQKAQKVREAIETLLAKFKGDGYIKGFKFYKEGRSFKGIEIIY